MANLSNINNKFLVTTGGNVGIGVTGPTAKLHIGVSSANDDTFHIFNGSVRTHLLGSESSNGVIYLRSSANSNKVRINTSGDSYLNGGNVGIGTTSPDANLHVNSENTAGTVIIGRTGTNIAASTSIGTITFPADYNSSAANYAQIRAYSNNLSAVRASLDLNVKSTSGTLLTGLTVYGTSSGVNVGIGTASPENKLHILRSSSDTQSQLMVQNGSTGDAAIKFNVSGQSYVMGIDYDDSKKFKIASSSNLGTTDRITLLSSGNVGIGTISPGTKLDVEGGGRFEGNVGIGTAPTSRQLSVFRTTAGSIANFLHYTDSSNFQGLYIQVSQTTDMVTLQSSGASGGGFIFSSGNAEKIRFTATGNVGIGTTTPGQKLEVAGRIRVTTDPTIEFYESSSKRGGIQWSTANDYTNIFAVGGDIRFDIGGEKMRITSAGGISFGSSGTAYGATGEVLTSNGNAAPTWQAAGGGSAWPQEKFAEYTIDSTTSNILVATLNSTTWHSNYLAGCLKFTFSTSDYIQVTYLPVSTFLSAGNKLFFKGTEMTTKNNGSNPATITITFAGNNGSYGSTCTVKLNRNQSISTYTKVNVLIQAISNPNMFILN